MSIFPVKLIEWFPHPRKRTYGTYSDANHLHYSARMMVEYSKCRACGKQPKWSKAIGHHSIPWGNGDIWCSEKCLESRKVYTKTPRMKKPRGKTNKAFTYDFKQD